MEEPRDIGIIGLGVMGASLARNLASRGFKVAAYNRHPEAGRRLAREHPEARVDVAETLESFAACLARPRKILLMVSAGPAVDAVLAQLGPYLEAGDVVADAGNSLYTDTERRIKEPRPWSFLGMGVSGGEEGALRGPAIMAGGNRAAFDTLRPALEAMAARGPSGPCVAYCGAGSAGHFVKMVHNGIEYADMQLIAETVFLLREGLGYTAARAAQAFEIWNRGDLESYLVEITARILRTPDPQDPGGGPLVDAILDQAAQKGTGKWTVMAAADLGVPIPAIAAAVDGRGLSAARPRRLVAAELFPGRGPLALTLDDVRDALYAAKIASYAQGFDLLKAASGNRGFGTDLSEVARVWTAGCIIRAGFLEDVREAYLRDPALDLLAFTPFFAQGLRSREGAWRRVVAGAALAGLPMPGLCGALAWFDTLRAGRGSAALIQAQRDYFGAHTYERIDCPGTPVHTPWPAEPQER